MVPRAVVTDASLSITARLLFTVLDSRQGTNDYARVGRQALADDLGVSVATVKRALNELVEAGLIVREATGRTNSYTVVNLSRNGRLEQSVKAHEKATRKARRVTSEPSDGSLVTRLQSKNSLIKNKASTTAPPKASEGPPAEVAVAAAGDHEKKQKPSVEPFLVERFLASLPDPLRPKETQTVAEAVGQSAQRGWEPELLAARIAEEIPNRNAGPGLAVSLLRQFCQQPPAEFFGRVQREPWCGLCDEYSRLRETAQGAVERCTACHPLRTTSEEISPLEGSSLTAEEPAGDGAQYVEMIRADLMARNGFHDETDALLEELALAEPETDALLEELALAEPETDALLEELALAEQAEALTAFGSVA